MKINERISVIAVYNKEKGQVYPQSLLWNGRRYEILKIGYHHKAKHGQTLVHYFSVTSNTLFFKLRLDTDNLHWFVEEISDGLTD